MSSDQLPRIQSTKRRPLSIKARETLENELLSLIRHARKHSMSNTTQDQKRKRSQ